LEADAFGESRDASRATPHLAKAVAADRATALIGEDEALVAHWEPLKVAGEGFKHDRWQRNRPAARRRLRWCEVWLSAGEGDGLLLDDKAPSKEVDVRQREP
jgi:hypothetical protein